MRLYYWKKHTETRLSSLAQGQVLPADSPSIMHTNNTQNPRDLDLWPMTLIFSRLLEVAKIHVHAKFRQVKCSGSWVVLVTQKKKQKKLSDDAENNTAVASAGSKQRNLSWKPTDHCFLYWQYRKQWTDGRTWSWLRGWWRERTFRRRWSHGRILGRWCRWPWTRSEECSGPDRRRWCHLSAATAGSYAPRETYPLFYSN